jgi:hypothetical protein
MAGAVAIDREFLLPDPDGPGLQVFLQHVARAGYVGQFVGEE